MDRAIDLILIGFFAFCQMRADLARFIVANESDIKIFVVVREVRGGRFGCRRAVTGKILAEIGDREFRFARMILEKILQFGRAMHARNIREWNFGDVRRRRGCRRSYGGLGESRRSHE